MRRPSWEEIGWSSERTASRRGPTYRVVVCFVCNRTGKRWERTTLGDGLMLVRCGECGGASWYAELVQRLPE